jgi:hypothetical protein
MSTLRPALLAVLASLTFGCAAAAEKDVVPGANGGAEPPGSGLDLGGGSGAEAGVPLGDGSGADCSDANKQIYVVSQEKGLYRFAPATRAFTKIGVLACPAASTSRPFSMAVDRTGTAWVLYNDGRLYNVSTTDASCTATSFVPGQKGWRTFGMAFVADAPGSASESLYVSTGRWSDPTNPDSGWQAIAKIDTKSLSLSVVGDVFPSTAELTGTGSAKLFAFVTGDYLNPSAVTEVDRSSGAPLAPKKLDGLGDIGAFAFAFWGGKFWIFTATGTGSDRSKLTLYSHADGTSSLALPDVGFTVVGAGVSTCAPTREPPPQ